MKKGARILLVLSLFVALAATAENSLVPKLNLETRTRVAAAEGQAPPVGGELFPAYKASAQAAQEDKTLSELESQYKEGKGADEFKNMKDPLKPWNLVWFHFNDKLQLWVVRPAATGYGHVVPKPVRTGISNFFKNLKTPIPLISCLLQGRWKDMGVVAERFGVNTTAGVLGFMDVAAKKLDLSERDEDIDQAFGSWGIPPGCYLVWPFFGPSSVRGTFGLVGDTALTPYTWVPASEIVSPCANATNTVNETSFHPNEYRNFESGAMDSYTALRQAYYEYRRAADRKKLVEE